MFHNLTYYPFFSNVLDTNTCGSSFCKHKTANSSKVTYQSFKTYWDVKLDITTPISKISVSTFYLCAANCSRVSDCTSVNYNRISKEENCELLFENAYENRADLKHAIGWKHSTTSEFFFSYAFDFGFRSSWLKAYKSSDSVKRGNLLNCANDDQRTALESTSF